jgi:5-methylcytosine-specific restriction endonuclease McrA
VERLSDKRRTEFAKGWLKPFRDQFDVDQYKLDPEYRERKKAAFRDRYGKTIEAERARVADYKLAHSDLNNGWSRTRNERVSLQADGTLTTAVILRLKAEASGCAYCGTPLEGLRKDTDHITPICYGGEHSLRNVVICCAPCNGRKATLMPLEWLERIGQVHRERVESLYGSRGIGRSYADHHATLQIKERVPPGQMLHRGVHHPALALVTEPKIG